MSEYIIKKDDNGKTISVRDVQLVLLEMMKDLDALFVRHQITYYLTGGSALGAVRHEGFIPWDDDVDFGMMRNDYKKLLEVKSELEDKYVIQCFTTHDEYNVLIPAMKIRKKGTYCEEYNSLLKNRCKDSDGLFIDIFIIDYVSTNKFVDVSRRISNACLALPIFLMDNIGVNMKWLKKAYVNNAIKYGIKHRHSGRIGYEITWLFDSFIHPVSYSYDSVYPPRYVKFEDSLFPIPNDPHEMLISEVGDNYMSYPPLKDQQPKHLKDIEL